MLSHMVANMRGDTESRGINNAGTAVMISNNKNIVWSMAMELLC